MDYHHVQAPFEIVLWIMLASLAKLGKHHYWLNMKHAKMETMNNVVIEGILELVSMFSIATSYHSSFYSSCLHGMIPKPPERPFPHF